MMGIFRKANDKLEGMVEGGFGRAFKSSVQPVEIAHKLGKEMGDHKTVGVSNIYVPNEFDVYLGRDDYEQLVAIRDSLKVELANYVTAFARREGWTLAAPPHIELHKDTDLRLGEFGIAAHTVSAPGPPPAAAAVGAAGLGAAALNDQTLLYRESAAASRPRAGMRALLRGANAEYSLDREISVIGRSRRCDVVLGDPNVSRQHAEIRRQGDGFLLVDLGSTNGTRVNRRDIKQVVLQHGDRIEFGTSELVFER